MTEKTPREEILDEAKSLIVGDRNCSYGPPTQDFDRTAAILNAMGFQFVRSDDIVQDIQGHHIAMLMVALKLSRLCWDPTKRDSWVDMAGYAANGWECAEPHAPDPANEGWPHGWKSLGEAESIVVHTEDSEKYPSRWQMGQGHVYDEGAHLPLLDDGDVEDEGLVA